MKNQKMLKWRIYYADNTTFDSSQGEPHEAPGTRIAFIIHRHRDKRELPYIVWRDDYYIWKFGEWLTACRRQFEHYIFHERYEHKKAALAGEMIPNHIWNPLVERGKLDMLDK